jgi:hypothetical protein
LFDVLGKQLRELANCPIQAIENMNAAMPRRGIFAFGQFV